MAKLVKYRSRGKRRMMSPAYTTYVLRYYRFNKWYQTHLFTMVNKWGIQTLKG